MSATGVLIIAESGGGKSASIESLDEKETFIINVADKPLPFKGWKKRYTKVSPENPTGNMSTASSAAGILKAMDHVNDKRPEIKSLVIDDWQYMSAFEFFDRVDEKSYDKFTDIGSDISKVARKVKTMREDLVVFFLTHAEDHIDGRGRRKVKAKTIGKMVDEKLTLEGLFSIVLYGRMKKDKDGNIKYVFETQSDGENTCKSPKGMFADRDIDNSLQIVKDAIKAYEE